MNSPRAAAPRVVGLLRVRNEAAILRDTLDHMSTFCDGGVFVYDDASTDDTVGICRRHPIVSEVICGPFWDPNRGRAEYRNRACVLDRARALVPSARWLVYQDADERIEFDWETLDQLPAHVVGVRMKLFDFYITPGDRDADYRHRRLMGPEYRSLLMVFRNHPDLSFHVPDQREVRIGTPGQVVEAGFVRHYGKAISVAQWDETCDYYSRHFPCYADKWRARKGHAVHDVSDQGRPLITWQEKETKGHPLEADVSSRRTPERDLMRPGALSVLVTNHQMLAFTGSEVFTFTVADFLTRQGHAVTVYSRYVDKYQRPLERLGVRVVNHLAAVKDEHFDVAHVHHNVNAIEVRHWFPALPMVLLTHGVLPSLEQLPVVDVGVAQHLAVSEEVQDHLAMHGIPVERVGLFRNPVDTALFSPASAIEAVPRRALIVSARLDEERERVIRGALSRLGIRPHFVGGRFGEVEPATLPLLINRADIVFSLGRGAIEAMLCGRIPVVYDYLGGDGLVTPATLPEMMRCNFSGRRYRHQYTEDELVRELRQYRAEDAAVLRQSALQEYDAATQIDRLLEYYRRAIQAGVGAEDVARNTAVARVVAMIEDTRHYTGVLVRQPLSDEAAALSLQSVPRPTCVADAAEYDAAISDIHDQLWLRDDARLHEELGRIHFHAGRLLEASHHFRVAVELNPQNYSASKSLSLVIQSRLPECEVVEGRLDAQQRRIAALDTETAHWRSAYFDSHLAGLARKASDAGLQRVVVWGAGFGGQAVVRACGVVGVDVLAVADRDPSTWGGDVEGVPVVGPDDALARGAQAVLIASLGSASAIRSTVLALADQAGVRIEILMP